MASVLDLALERQEQERESAREQRFKEQVRARELARFLNPDADAVLEKVWVAHVWVPEGDDPKVGEWKLAGFRRKRNRRKPQTMGRFFGKIRRQFGLDKKAPVLLMDLGRAKRQMEQADQSWRYRPPQFQTRKPKMAQRAPVVDRRKRKTRAKVRAPLLNKRATQYIAIGRNTWDRKPGYLYLGPLKATAKRQAQQEAKRTFSIWQEIIIIPVSDLSKSLRGQMMRSKKVRAGVTRIAWPEVPPSFDDMLAKYFRKQRIDKEEDRQMIGAQLRAEWTAQGEPWLSVGWLRATRRKLAPARSKVVYRDRLYHCSKCKGSGKQPSTIQHASALCVPISAEENTVCATDAKAHARKIADRRRKRSERRAEAKAKVERAKVRKRAAKKAARTRRKNSQRSSAKRVLHLRVFLKHIKEKSSASMQPGKSTSRRPSGSADKIKRGKSAGSGKASGRSSRSTLRKTSGSPKKSASKPRTPSARRAYRTSR